MVIKTKLTGFELIRNPRLNKDTAFSKEERAEFHLEGILPNAIETLPEQLIRIKDQYETKETDLDRFIFLSALHDRNEVLFYRLIIDALSEFLPIVYTPTIGDAVKTYSTQLRRPRGLFIGYSQRDQIRKLLKSHAKPRLVVATDGEGVLGIGDWGIGGMDISIGKLVVYSACGGLNPQYGLPIQLDVGTNNQALLDDPMYLGWRHERITGEAYLAFTDQFMALTAINGYPWPLDRAYWIVPVK